MLKKKKKEMEGGIIAHCLSAVTLGQCDAIE